MRTLLATNDIVTLSLVQSLLDEAGIPWFLFDAHQSSIDGSIGVIPRRLNVVDEDWDAAVRLLEREGLSGEIAYPKAQSEPPSRARGWLDWLLGPAR